MKNKKTKLYSLLFKVIITTIFGIAMFCITEYIMTDDDTVYSKVFNSFETFVSWAWEFYNIWSGRVITSALSNIFLRMPLVVFRIFNIVVLITGIIAIYKIIKSFVKIDNIIVDNLIYISLFLLYFVIPEDVVQYSVKWVTGSFNYLWPAAFMFVAMIPFVKRFNEEKDENEGNKFFIIYILSDFIACFAEQTTLVLLTIGTLVIGYSIIRKQRINKLLIAHYLIILILTTIELAAPGNFVRFEASTLRRFPTFNMLNVGDKLIQGIICLANQLLTNDNILMLILTVIIAITNLIKNKSVVVKISSCIPAIYFLGIRICSKLGIGETIIYNLPFWGKEYIYGLKIFIPLIVFVIMLWLITELIASSFKDVKKGIATSIIFLGSIAASLTISFSPTIYVSGARTYFLGDLLFVLVIGIMLANLFEFRKVKKQKRSKYILYGGNYEKRKMF